MNVACPQCGNPNLDVDPQSNTVYCKNCGFAVQVDPQTGNVTPISGGGMPTGGGGTMGGPSPMAGGYPDAGASRVILGMDPITFFLLGTVVTVLLWLATNQFEFLLFGEIVVFLVYWYNH
jgi:hypothetical protein